MRYRAWFVWMVLGVAPGCRGGDATTEGAGEEALGAAEEPAARDEGPARFDRDIRKRVCELLSPALVASTFDVPEDELRQVRVMGCSYAWKSEGEVLEASITMARAHASEADAARWFRNATANKSAEQIAEEKARVAERLDKSDRLGSDEARERAKSLVDMLPGDAVRYEKISGVGDEAMRSEDGALYVRLSNLTFTARAYRGAGAPALDTKGMKPGDLIAAAKARNAAFLEATRSERARDAETLAEAFLGAL